MYKFHLANHRHFLYEAEATYLELYFLGNIFYTFLPEENCSQPQMLF
jgi:hypothetical protein